jgi:hypothetical protein
VQRLKLERAEDEEVEGALQEFDGLAQAGNDIDIRYRPSK